ncbi:hypothetical protein IFM89_000901 [Coptis chinensis]|uniref:BRO1 domain-containing protein n=1 Tax=Coptis chinensis TaxID=261450 RepID=A0A835MC28_9MAGN|nr:hypothetical protein IFM89_000901 [Coptis chinensis]
MQRLVDNVLAVTKESVKTFTYESLNNSIRLINGVSALVLAVLPGKATILENMHGWELRPTFAGPRLPRWMENGVSSFNEFIHELSVDSDTSSIDYASDEEYYDDSMSSTPQSQDSRVSRASSFSKYDRRDRRQSRWFKYIFSWIMWPITLLLRIPFRLLHSSGYRSSTAPSTSGNTQPPHVHSSMKFNFIKDHIIHRTTDRRRGVVEDLQLAIEIFIEAIFDVVHKAAHFMLSPSEAFRALFRLFSSHDRQNKDIPNDNARTCQDVITELGYPYEAISVVTSDGYVLLLERIPRRDARKAVYLQHGIMDSSMGWVSNGVVGSPAFAAFDQGYDVFLGNFRGLVSREHINKNLSSRQYWRYSINEHGTQDIPALIEMIHQVKTSELKNSQPDLEEEINGDQPYKLCAICHSLGGAAILMYVITRRIEEKPHRLSRLILLSPAGFHDDSSFMFTLVEYMFLLLGPILAPIMPGLYIPTRFFRMLLNKLARDFQNYPAVGGLVQTLMSYVVGGDSSNWVGVMGLPHYNMNDMPGVSFYVALHLAQMKRLGEVHNGHPPTMVRKHYNLMKDSGVEVSFNEFEYAHLDFTFSHREELLAYVMSSLLMVVPPPRKKRNLKPLKLKKIDGDVLTKSYLRNFASLLFSGFPLPCLQVEALTYPVKLKTKKVVFEDIYTTTYPGTFEYLKELSSKRRVIEESLNHSSSPATTIARQTSGALTSRCQQDLQNLEQYLPLLENLMSCVTSIKDNHLILVSKYPKLNIRWSSALSSSNIFKLTGAKFFHIDHLHFELAMTLFLYGAILRERALEVFSTDLVQASTLYRTAAGVYQYLSSQLLPLLGSPLNKERPPEYTSELTSIMRLICLSEAQAVTLRKAEEKGSSTGVLSKLHYGIKLLLDEATTTLHSLKKRCKNISTRLEMKRQMPGDESWRPIFKTEINGVAEMLRKLEHENDFVWHDKVPSDSQLPPLEGNSWLWDVGGLKILVDPILVGNLDFGIPWLYDAAKRFLKTFQLSDLPEIDCLLITQSLDDHCHLKTLQPLSKMFPDLPVIATPNAETLLSPLFKNKQCRGTLVVIVYGLSIRPFYDFGLGWARLQPRSRHNDTLEPDENPRLIRASSSWLRSRAHELPELKEKCKSLFVRIRKGRRHTSPGSGDYKYDPLSYALNFDQGSGEFPDDDDDFPVRNFSSRLPASPPQPLDKGVTRPVTYLEPGQSSEIEGKLGSKVTVKATAGPVLGPPWQRPENGYIITSQQGQLTLYYEPHCVYNKELLQKEQSDIVITPVIKQLLPKFTLVSGQEDAVQLAKVLHAKYIVPMRNGELDSKGLLASIVRSEGTMESFKELLSKEVPDAEVLESAPGVPLEILAP